MSPISHHAIRKVYKVARHTVFLRRSCSHEKVLFLRFSYGFLRLSLPLSADLLTVLLVLPSGITSPMDNKKLATGAGKEIVIDFAESDDGEGQRAARTLSPGGIPERYLLFPSLSTLASSIHQRHHSVVNHCTLCPFPSTCQRGPALLGYGE